MTLQKNNLSAVREFFIFFLGTKGMVSGNAYQPLTSRLPAAYYTAYHAAYIVSPRQLLRPLSCHAGHFIYLFRKHALERVFENLSREQL